MSKSVAANWTAGAAKALERQYAQLLAAAEDMSPQQAAS
jgi:hypothetical protein